MRPVHETLVASDGRDLEICHMSGFIPLIKHLPDASKPRGDLYLRLLRLAVQENPLDERCRIYLQREELFAKHAVFGGSVAGYLAFAEQAARANCYVEARHAYQMAAECAPKEERERVLAMAELAGFNLSYPKEAK